MKDKHNYKKKTELLAPAGSLDKLKIAALYGADAVYFAGENFGLRTAANNFSYEEIAEGIEFLHKKGKKAYITVNSYLHDLELEELPDFLKYLNQVKPDALIISDLGTIKVANRHSNIPIHLSTQSTCINSESARFWKEMNVERIVLGREISINSAKKIREECDIEVELFIHGAMCISYSGQCALSTYLSGRDSNRGGCAHNCRFIYDYEDSSKVKNEGFFFSSKDLCAAPLIPQLLESRIDSLKIEGRMKGHLYVGGVVSCYRQLIDRAYITDFSNHLSLASYLNFSHDVEEELQKYASRDLTVGNLNTPADSSSIYSKRDNLSNSFDAVGFVIDAIIDKGIMIEVRKAFNKNDFLDILKFSGAVTKIQCHTIKTLLGTPVERARPGSIVFIPYVDGIEKYSIVRGKIEHE